VATPPIIETMNQLFNPVERAAWRGFVRSHSALLRRLDADLRRAHGISISAYEALIILGRSDAGSLQMSELAGRTLLTQSGISRLVTRLERDGLVRREADPTDRRASRISLTESGAQVLRDGMRTHFDGVRNRFLNRFSDAELIQLADFWDRLTDESRDEENERAAGR
jgi:DNA-binding MarR family transcriptional regulator